jgi:hypothetical protein
MFRVSRQHPVSGIQNLISVIQTFNYLARMGLRSMLVKPYAAYVAAQTKKWSLQPALYQNKIFQHLIAQGKSTSFGRDHHFGDVRSYEDFKKHVPIRDYEGLKPYMDRVVKGEENVLWKGKPKYLAKTSGTTSGVKYIPISHESVSTHFKSSLHAVLSYVHESGKASFLEGNLIFLSGSPELERKNGILTGRLSGISNHEIP